MFPHSQELKIVIGVIGNIIGVGVNLAPMPTFWKIFKKKSTQDFSGLPYVFALIAALLWVLYGLPMVTKSAVLLITINVASSSIQIFYLTIFFLYASKKARIQVLAVLVACLMAFATAVGLTLGAVQQRKRSKTVGILCVVIGIITYASPLSVARMVIRTRSVEFLPILLCVFFLINSITWTCYGLVTRDVFVLIPNGIGVLFGTSQILLYLIYRNATPIPKPIGKKAFDEEVSVRGKSGDAVIEMPSGTFGKTKDRTPDMKTGKSEKKTGKNEKKPGKSEKKVKASSLPSNKESNGHLPASNGHLPDSNGHLPESNGHLPESNGHLPA